MRKKNEIIWILPSISVFIILLMIKFCTPKINEKYIIYKIKRENFELFIDMKGNVAAGNITKIGMDLNLFVDDVLYKAGDFVKKGDIIIKFSDYAESEINMKKELLAVKNAQLRNLETRMRLGVDVLSEIQEIKGEIAALEPEINRNERNRLLIRRNIKSPFDAYILKINVLKGGITNKNEPVVILGKREDLKIVSEAVPNDKVKKLDIGNTAEIIIFRGQNKKMVNGKLFKINKVNNMNKFEIYPTSFKELILDERADIRVYYQKKENVLTVPKQSVIFKDDKSYIYLIDKNNLVTEKEITVGLDNGEKVEILGIDVENEMEIVGNPDSKIKNNVIVERKKIEEEEKENKKKLEKRWREKMKN